LDTLGMVRAILREIDGQMAVIESSLVEGKVESWEAYRASVGRRQGLLAGRRAVVECLTDEQRQFLGVR
jgi:hypothetical protein